MSECTRIRELIERGAYIDVSAEGFHEVAEHAVRCSDCARLLKELRQAEGTVRTALRWAEPGEGFRARVMRDINAPRRRRWLAPLAVAATIALAALLTVLATMRPDRTHRPPSEAGPRQPAQLAATITPARMSGRFALPDAEKIDRDMPVSADIVASGSRAAFEVVHGVGFALRSNTVFRISPRSTTGYTRVELQRGAAAVSVRTDNEAEKVEIAVDGFSVLASNADFLVETRTNGDKPGLYVGRGRVLVSFKGGVSAVERGEHVELVAVQLLSRVHAGEAQIKADLATLERQCQDLGNQIARYEKMVQTYAARRRERNSELEMTQEAFALAPDNATARRLEERINREMSAVKNLDFVLGEHIAKMSSLRAQLPKRRSELRRRRAMAGKQRQECKRGLALLADLR